MTSWLLALPALYIALCVVLTIWGDNPTTSSASGNDITGQV